MPPVGPIAWPAFIVGMVVVAAAGGALAASARAYRAGAVDGRGAVSSPVAMLAATLVLIAGALLVLYALNLSGNLGA